jgi:hypothetical protein
MFLMMQILKKKRKVRITRVKMLGFGENQLKQNTCRKDLEIAMSKQDLTV